METILVFIVSVHNLYPCCFVIKEIYTLGCHNVLLLVESAAILFQITETTKHDKNGCIYKKVMQGQNTDSFRKLSQFSELGQVHHECISRNQKDIWSSYLMEFSYFERLWGFIGP